MTLNLSDLQTFDVTDYLTDKESMQSFLNDAFETGNVEFIAHSLGVIAKAKGMSKVAQKTGLSRESLYRALSKNGNPTFKTILLVTQALGFSLTAITS
jgi:probable addiction module antidote protein